MKFKRFTKPQFLKQIGQALLGRLFDRFRGELTARQLALPPAALDDDAYFAALARLALAPEGLPDNLIETLFALEELANAEGQERLERAVREARLELTFAAESSPGDIAVQVWLASPEVLVATHNEQRLSRLAAFEYYGSKAPVDRRCVPHGPPFAAPGQPVLDLLVADLDGWFQAHNRGEQTAQIEVHALDGEFWFLVRHGDTFARTATVELRRTAVLHFRPAKDDVVVYAPERDELRVHAGTKGERELYRRAFGRRLMGAADYFSERKAYTLEPLRTLGADALDVAGLEGLRRVVLREYEIAFDSRRAGVLIRKADDLFAGGDGPFGEAASIPATGRLVRAVFDFHFAGAKKPRRVQVRPPNTLKLGRYGDARLVHRWLSAANFRVSVNGHEKGGGHVAVLACA